MTALVDEFDIIRRWKRLSTLIVCCVLFLAGLPCTTQVRSTCRLSLSYWAVLCASEPIIRNV